MQDWLRMDDHSRRSFMTRAAQTFLGVSMLPHVGFAADGQTAPAPKPSRAATADACIYLYMAGGMSHLDTFDTKPGGATQGPTKSISTKADGIQIAEHLPLTAAQMDKIAVVRSLHSKQGAHERGQYLMRTSYAPLASIRHPAMGAWAAALLPRLNPQLPGNIVISGGSQHPGAGFLDAKYAPLMIGDPEAGLQNTKMDKAITEQQFNHRLQLSQTFDNAFRARYSTKDVNAYADYYRDAVRLMKSDDLAAFDLDQETQQVRNGYGTERFGQGCLLARRLVEHGVRFVEVTFNGWDTHQDNFDRVPDLCQTLDQAYSALLQDLQAKGLLKRTLVVLATEFGRSPKINERDGRDHHPGVFSCTLAGGGIKGGQTYGSSDDRGHSPADKPVAIPDFNATIAHALGLPLEEKVTSKSGRPFTIADKGAPITALF